MPPHYWKIWKTTLSKFFMNIIIIHNSLFYFSSVFLLFLFFLLFFLGGGAAVPSRPKWRPWWHPCPRFACNLFRKVLHLYQNQIVQFDCSFYLLLQQPSDLVLVNSNFAVWLKFSLVLLNTQYIYISLAFPADIGRNPASPARGSGKRLHAGFAGQLMKLPTVQHGAPVWSVTTEHYILVAVVLYLYFKVGITNPSLEPNKNL